MNPRAKITLAKRPAKGVSALATWRALKVGEVMDMERLSGGHNYGKHDHIGERHTGKDIETTHPLYVSRPATTELIGWYGLSASFGCVAHLFDPVSTLPEKEIRERSLCRALPNVDPIARIRPNRSAVESRLATNREASTCLGRILQNKSDCLSCEKIETLNALLVAD